ncbi:hypothetical protein BZG36_03419 [Bifiguratus adelaidae]|uniref:Cytochrome b561 domain-containing protein n=1 Tax=Bifiguratus adelaidae TaxID=1938954 RepID=A0A261XYS7_9FUNG|nr:hypothetical protein BZG36_03419 [Bifiguratus adelaidae]
MTESKIFSCVLVLGTLVMQAQAVEFGEKQARMLLIHGCLMIWAWIFMAFAGFVIVRFSNAWIKNFWFRGHAIIMAIFLGLPFVAAWALAYCTVPAPLRFLTPHGRLGAAVGILFILQILLGIFNRVHFLWKGSHDRVPWTNHLHAWLGRGTLLIGAVNVAFGLVTYVVPTPVYIVYGIVVGVFLVIIIVLQFKYGDTKRKHPHEAQSIDVEEMKWREPLRIEEGPDTKHSVYYLLEIYIMVYLADAVKRKSYESRKWVTLRAVVAIALLFATVAYAIKLGIDIAAEGNNGNRSVKLINEVHTNYTMPDVVICANYTSPLVYTCAFTMADLSSQNCQQFMTQTFSNPDPVSEFPYCTMFASNGNALFNRWTGIRSLGITVNMTSGLGPDNVQVQLFDHSANYVLTNKSCNQLTSDLVYQEACDQNIYFMSLHEQLFTSFTASIHQVLVQNGWATIGVGNQFTNESSIASSTEKEPWGTDQVIYGLLTVKPAAYVVQVQQDQRTHTILAAMGLLGGAYGVLAGIYVILWGQPHLQPIGVIERVSSFLESRLRGRQMSTSQSLPSYAEVVPPIHSKRSSNDQIHLLENAAFVRHMSDETIPNSNLRDLHQRLRVVETVLADFVIDLDKLSDKSAKTRS